MPKTALRTLSLDERGQAVEELQRLFGIASDGVFSIDTERAVKALQRAKGLNPGRHCWAAHLGGAEHARLMPFPIGWALLALAVIAGLVAMMSLTRKHLKALSTTRNDCTMSTETAQAIDTLKREVIATTTRAVAAASTGMDQGDAAAVARDVIKEVVPVVVNQANAEPWYQSRVN